MKKLMDEIGLEVNGLGPVEYHFLNHIIEAYVVCRVRGSDSLTERAQAGGPEELPKIARELMPEMLHELAEIVAKVTVA